MCGLVVSGSGEGRCPWVHILCRGDVLIWKLGEGDVRQHRDGAEKAENLSQPAEILWHQEHLGKDFRDMLDKQRLYQKEGSVYIFYFEHSFNGF